MGQHTPEQTVHDRANARQIALLQASLRGASVAASAGSPGTETPTGASTPALPPERGHGGRGEGDRPTSVGATR